MALALLIVRLALSGIFLAAAASKFADRPGTRQAVIGFGVPERLAGTVSAALPASEIVVALLLIPGAVAWLGGAAALVLLAALSVTIAVNLARGNQPDCHCFGQLYSEPISPWTLARNGVLAAAALLVLLGERVNQDPAALRLLGQVPNDRWIEWAGGALVVALLAVQLWLVLRLLRENQQVFIRLKMLEADIRSGVSVATQPPEPESPGLAPGAPAPNFELPDLEGRRVTLDELLDGGRPVLLVFISPDCAACETLSPQIAVWQRHLADSLTVVPVSSGKVRTNREKAERYDLRGVLIQDKFEVELSLGVTGTPSAVLIREDGTVGSPVAVGTHEIHRLLEQVMELLAVPASARRDIADAAFDDGGTDPAFGLPAPDFRLRDLRGATVELRDLEGQLTLAFFWWTECGFCRGMLPEIKEWDANPPADAPRLVMIATGDEGAIRQQLGDLGSLVLLDNDFATAHAFGAEGTPLAALLDADGTYITRIAGEPAILKALRINTDPQPAADIAV